MPDNLTLCGEGYNISRNPNNRGVALRQRLEGTHGRLPSRVPLAIAPARQHRSHYRGNVRGACAILHQRHSAHHFKNQLFNRAKAGLMALLNALAYRNPLILVGVCRTRPTGIGEGSTAFPCERLLAHGARCPPHNHTARHFPRPWDIANGYRRERLTAIRQRVRGTYRWVIIMKAKHCRDSLLVRRWGRIIGFGHSGNLTCSMVKSRAG